MPIIAPESFSSQFAKQRLSDPSGFYEGLTTILDAEPEAKAGVPQLMALSDMVGYYRATIRLIEYDIAINTALADGNISKVEKLQRAQSSEQNRFQNFSNKRDLSSGMSDPKATAKNELYSSFHDYWPTRRAALESGQLNLMIQRYPNAGETRNALRSAKRIRNTLGVIRDRYHERIIVNNL
jgi:hypothetical protein